MLVLTRSVGSLCCLLDLSAAFDTQTNSSYRHNYNKRFGISGSVLFLFSKYCADQPQIVTVNGSEIFTTVL